MCGGKFVLVIRGAYIRGGIYSGRLIFGILRYVITFLCNFTQIKVIRIAFECRTKLSLPLIWALPDKYRGSSFVCLLSFKSNTVASFLILNLVQCLKTKFTQS